MRGRTVVLLLIAALIAGGTAYLVRSALNQRAVVAETKPQPPPHPQKQILVAAATIARGQILKPADLVWRPWPEAEIAADYILAGAGPETSFAGWVAREPFVAGEPIIKAKIVAPGDHGFLAAVLGPGMRAVSIAVDQTSDVAGFILPGDRVDVLLNLSSSGEGSNGNGDVHKAAETVLRGVRIIAIDQRPDSKDGQAVVARTVTLEVTPKQSEIVALAADMGKLSLSLRSLVGASQDASPVVAATTSEAASTAASAGDSIDGRNRPSFTLDSEVDPLLHKPQRIKHNLHDDKVCILRGSGNSSNGCESQSPPQGS
jgi:pilus assembly protein CpaB